MNILQMRSQTLKSEEFGKNQQFEFEISHQRHQGKSDKTAPVRATVVFWGLTALGLLLIFFGCSLL